MSATITLLLVSAAVTADNLNSQSSDIFATDPAMIKEFQSIHRSAREARIAQSRELHRQRQLAKGAQRYARTQAKYAANRQYWDQRYAAERQAKATAGQRMAAYQLDTIARTGYQLQRAYAPPPSCHSRRRATLQGLPPLR